MPSQLTEVAERVKWVLKKVWSGSQTRMAADIGVSQSAISNVVTGRQQPGRKFLAAVASNSLVNSTWLITGDGDALVQQAVEPGRRALYVASCLFEGLPQDHGDCLESMIEVPTIYYRPSRYWIQIRADSPLLQSGFSKLAAGDLVLFEPESKNWPETLVGRPCIHKTDTGELRSEFIEKQSGDQFWTTTVAEREEIDPDFRKRRRAIILDTEPNAECASARLPLERDSLIAVGIFRMGGFELH